ncbi:MAG: glycosyltransferase [Pyrinomonadaceae bacterium]|nr:glycosyltransferase [Pyrinomonadaceae bacterium]MDQ3133857.1 glycosyltransferase [Acidobacteriota bacterium]
MKVVRIIARLNVGGPARHVAWVTAGLRGRGFDSVLVAGVVPPGEDDMGYFAAQHGVEPLVIPEMSREISPRDAITIWKLYRLFKQLRPDLVHTHTAKAGTVGRVAGWCYRWITPGVFVNRPRRCRFVHTYHGHIFHSYYGKWRTRLFLLIERVLARLATDRIVVISPQQFHEIHEQFGVGRAGQFAVVPLGIDLGVFNHWAARRPPARRELGAGDGDLLVGIVGRLTEIKNHELFLQAAAQYRRGGAAGARRVRFLVIGDGHLREKLEAQARQLNLGEDVTFTGTRDDPENFYPALDIVALTSRNEGTPLTLIEAMANARPVVATAVGGVVDLLGELQSSALGQPRAWHICERGVRVQPGDAEGFAQALGYLIENQELREQMGARGHEYVQRYHSKERLVDDLEQIYEELWRPATSKRQRGGQVEIERLPGS